MLLSKVSKWWRKVERFCEKKNQSEKLKHFQSLLGVVKVNKTPTVILKN